MTPQVSVVIPAYNEGEAIMPCLDRIFAGVTLPCEVLVVYDDAADTTIPYLEKYARDEPRLLPVLNEYGRGPARAIRWGIEHARAPVTVVTMAKAYSTDFVRRVGIESDAGFEVGIELVAKARRLRLPVAELPTIWLERGHGQSNFRVMRWLPLYLHWYRFAFGPQLTREHLQGRTRATAQ